MANKNKKQCILYTRVSSDKQEDRYSIPYQMRILSEYAEREGLEIVQVYTEVETAAKPGRPQFNALISLLKQPDAPQIVLVDTVDRLTRNDRDKDMVREVVQAHQVEFRIVRTGAVWDRDASPDDEFMQDIEVAVAKRYISHLRRETLKGIRQKIFSGGWCGPAPHGYRNNKETKTIEIDPQESIFVKRVFHLFTQGGHSIRTLREALFQEGYFFTPSQPKISKSQLHYMLRNRAYIGENEYEGTVYQANHEPIISGEQWQKAQKLLGSRSHHQGQQNFIYHGILFCGVCGASMVGEVKKGKYVYYRCWKSAEGSCSEKYTNENAINERMNALLHSLHFPADYKERMLAMMGRFSKTKQILANEEMTRLNGEKLRLETRIDRAYEDLVAGVISQAQYDRLNQRYTEQNEAIDKAYKNITSANIDSRDALKMYLELPEMMTRTWLHAAPEFKARLLKMITSNIFIESKEPSITLVSPFDKLQKMGQNKEKLPSMDALRTLLALHSEIIKSLHQSLAA